MAASRAGTLLRYFKRDRDDEERKDEENANRGDSQSTGVKKAKNDRDFYPGYFRFFLACNGELRFVGRSSIGQRPKTRAAKLDRNPETAHEKPLAPRVRDFKPAWKKDFVWLVYNETEGKNVLPVLCKFAKQ